MMEVVTESNVMAKAEVREGEKERDLKQKQGILWSLCGLCRKMSCLPSGVFSGCIFQLVECLT